MATLEELVIKISADTKGLKTELSNVQTQLKKTEATGVKAVSSLKGVLGTLGGVFVASKIISGLKETVNYMDDMADAADRVGISSESFSKLAYAAKQAEVDVSALEMGLRKMLLAFSEANNSNSGAAGAFKALNLDIQELKSLQPDVAFGKIADALNQVRDISSKTAIAQEIFGRGSAQLNDILKEGSAQIADWARQAENAGLVVTPEMAKKAEEAKRAFSELGGAYEGMKVALVDTGAITTITNLLNQLSSALLNVRHNMALIANSKSIMGLAEKVGSAQSEVNRTQAILKDPSSHQGVKWGLRSEDSVRQQAAQQWAKATQDLADAKKEYQSLTGDLVAGGANANLSAATGSTTTGVTGKTNNTIYSSGTGGGKSEAEKKVDDLKSKLKSLTESTKTDVMRAQDDINALQEAHLNKLIENGEEYDRIRAKLDENLKTAIRSADTLENRIKDIGNEAAASIGDELVEALRRGESAGEALWTSFKFNAIKAITDIGTQLLNSHLQKLFGGGAGGSSGGGLGDLLVEGGKAIWDALPSFDSGGMTGGKRGSGVDGKGGFPAILHPEEAVFNKKQLSGLGGGGGFNQTVVINATSQQEIDRRIMAQLPLIARAASDLTESRMGTGGSMSKQVGRRV